MGGRVSALDRFNVHRCPTWWVFSGTGLELVARQATIRYLYHSATAATSVLELAMKRTFVCIFDVKEAPRTGRPVVENVDKITKIIEVDRHLGSRSITQHLKIDHKTVLNHLRKVGFKKKLGVWVPHQ
ncbi:histonelysine Nmethyltransferase SETMARlike [Trichonephila clavipes]|nr:histonelysine Nmethyltransferase SETMARlike [Trichonephila clavipes]